MWMFGSMLRTARYVCFGRYHGSMNTASSDGMPMIVSVRTIERRFSDGETLRCFMLIPWVKLAVDGAEPLWSNASINLSGEQRTVAEQFLNLSDISTAT